MRFHKDDPALRPNLAIMGTQIPERLKPAMPAWATDPRVKPARDKPYDPPLEVDPPARNPYNDPDYAPFIVTENRSVNSVDGPAGGLLGMLRAMLLQEQAQPGPDPVSDPSRLPSLPQHLVRTLSRRSVY